ncbi:hypothetical protein [Polaribacter septentrionalilitoris]|uniref:hypothetical protein n=1 Tax=Polaribacter septentrionalilitoris TaxID=2494657 RepID=UPI001357C513|nr:hypothetical protein [Polaribacter septentrionalilitoris]
MIYIVIFIIVFFYIRFLWENSQKQTLEQILNKKKEAEFIRIKKEINENNEREFMRKLAFPNMHIDDEFDIVNKEENKMKPIIFKNLTINQRKSIVNFHNLVGLSDGEVNYQEAEIITKLCHLCKVSLEECMEYFDYEGGMEKLIKNLSTISNSEKDILNLSIWNLIICDGKPNEKELSITYSVLKNIGINENAFLESIEKGLKVQNDFNNN